MLVADLRHYVDLDDTTPTPARRLAAQLSSIVQAATARPAGPGWTSALGCTRRPARQRCVGLIVLRRSEVPPSIAWECDSCGDDGVINGWEGSRFDLRTGDTEPLDRTVEVPLEVVEVLRSVLFLDVESERLVFGARVVDGAALIEGTNDDVDALIDSIAAEANHEPDRRRQRRLDAAYDDLTRPSGPRRRR